MFRAHDGIEGDQRAEVVMERMSTGLGWRDVKFQLSKFFLKRFFFVFFSPRRLATVILLMAEILHQAVYSMIYQGFRHASPNFGHERYVFFWVLHPRLNSPKVDIQHGG